MDYINIESTKICITIMIDLGLLVTFLEILYAEHLWKPAKKHEV